MNLSAHFTLEELTHSDVAVRLGIENHPSPVEQSNLVRLAAGLEQVRALLGVPINVKSGYRSPALNTLVNGSHGSAHVDGLAADFIAPAYGSPRQIAMAIRDSAIAFDQLIFEGTWVHISFGTRMRREVLSASFIFGAATYQPGIA